MKSIYTVLYAALLAATAFVGSSHAAHNPAMPGLDLIVGVDPFTGASTATIPLAAPPGRAGMEPKLALTYNSHSGDGWIGMGWTLDPGTIRRSMKHGVPTYRNEYDRFEYVRGHVITELVRIAEGEYRPRREYGDFDRFILVEEGDASHWEILHKNGKRAFLGRTDASRLVDLHPPDGWNDRVFRWHLDSFVDTNGNTVELGYTERDSRTNEIFLEEIRYTGNTNTGHVPMHRVKFVTGSRPATDRTISQGSHIPIKSTGRLAAIRFLIEGYDGPVREYLLSYEDPEYPDFWHDPIITRSRLVSVAMKGAGGVGGLPPLTFEYSTMHNWSLNGYDTWDAEWPLIRVTEENGDDVHTLEDVFDLDADGLPDKVVSGGEGGWTLYRNTAGRIDASSPRPWPEHHGLMIDRFFSADCGGEECRPGRQLQAVLDMTGDVRPDIVVAGDDSWEVYVNTGDGFAPTATLWAGGSGPIEETVTSERTRSRTTVRKVFDLDGDGLPDLVTSDNGDEASWDIRRNAGYGFREDVESWPVPAGFDIREEQDRIGVRDTLDINGDGLPDLVEAGPDGDWRVYLNDGFGFERDLPLIWDDGGACIWESAAWIDDRYRDDTFDLNADGLPDRVRLTVGEDGRGIWSARFNQGGGFSDEIDIIGPALGGDLPLLRYFTSKGACKVDVLDITGDGLPDIVYSPSYPNSEHPWTVFENAGPVEGLLVEAGNGIGGTWSIEYSPSTVFDNAGENGVQGLPFPVQVVTAFSEADGLGNRSMARFEYSGGRYNADAREFTGFSSVERTNYGYEGTIEQVISSRFHTDERKGRLEKKTVSDSTGTPLAIREFDWAMEEICPDMIRVELASKSITHDDATRTTFYDYDDHGNVTTVRDLGAPVLAGDDRIETALYGAGRSGYLVDRRVETIVTDGLGDLVSRSRYFYDKEPFGAIGAQGNLTKVSRYLAVEDRWIPGDGLDATIVHDSDYGNIVAVHDALGRATAMAYDETYHAFLVEAVNPLGHRTAFSRDPVSGGILTAEDANGRIRENQYDAFGRLTAVIEPGDTIEDPSREILYDDSLLGDASRQAVGIRVRKDQDGGSHEASLRFDGLGRFIETRSDGPAGEIVSRTLCNASGGVAGSSLPRYAWEEPLWTWRGYDSLGRLLSVDHPDESREESSYNGWSHIHLDGEGHVRETVADAFGRTSELREFPDVAGAPVETRYNYDPAGRLIRVLAPGLHEMLIHYDSLGRKVGIDDPDAGTWSYTYDDLGNLAARTDADGQVLRFTHDALGRRLTEERLLPDGTWEIEIAYRYDEPRPGYDNKGMLTSVTDRAGTVTFDYDERSRMIRSRRAIDGEGIFEINRGFDPLGRLVRLVYPDGEALVYRYADTGTALRSVEDEGSGHVYADFSEHDALGRPGRVRYGNGVETDYSFDDRTLLVDAILTAGPTESILDVHYFYDHIGNVTETVEGDGQWRAFGYDGMERLVSMLTSDGEARDYAYDGTGNLVLKGATELHYDDPTHPRAVTSASDGFEASYDAGGKMTSLYGRALEYDSRGRPVQMEGLENTVRCRYDFSGARVEKSVDGQGSVLYIDELFEVRGGERTKHIFAGPMRIASKRCLGDGCIDPACGVIPVGDGPPFWTTLLATGFILGLPALFTLFVRIRGRSPLLRQGSVVILTAIVLVQLEPFWGIDRPLFLSGSTARASHIRTWYYHTDLLGSTAAVTDEYGSVAGTVRYHPFGEERSAEGAAAVNHLFTGGELDVETGLYLFGDRYYSPRMGRFITPDTIVPKAGTSVAFDRYAYAFNNPVNLVDPDGHAPVAAAMHGIHPTGVGLLNPFTLRPGAMDEPGGEGEGGEVAKETVVPPAEVELSLAQVTPSPEMLIAYLAAVGSALELIQMLLSMAVGNPMIFQNLLGITEVAVVLDALVSAMVAVMGMLMLMAVFGVGLTPAGWAAIAFGTYLVVKFVNDMAHLINQAREMRAREPDSAMMSGFRARASSGFGGAGATLAARAAGRPILPVRVSPLMRIDFHALVGCGPAGRPIPARDVPWGMFLDR